MAAIPQHHLDAYMALAEAHPEYDSVDIREHLGWSAHYCYRVMRALFPEWMADNDEWRKRAEERRIERERHLRKVGLEEIPRWPHYS